MSVKRFTVLLVEDNPGDARLIHESLQEVAGDLFNLETANRLATAMQRLEDGNVDAVLLDLALPDSSGQETFSKTKAQAPEVPIIVLTGLGDEALALRMVQQGAQDYLVKVDLNGSVLSRAIRYAIERSSAEQEIRKLNAELEQKVQARTAELEFAIKELEAFTYSVSHDLRAPVRHIDGFCKILMESYAESLDPEGRACVEGIHRASRQMSSMTQDLLKLAQVGKQRLNLQFTSLTELVNQVMTELKQEIQNRRIAWKVGVLPSVECDPGLMKQVFVNLIGNAVKYTRRRETAEIEIGQTTASGSPAIFIADNGAGFDMKFADKLFAPFQRLHSANDFEGTGVGLSTVQRIIQRQGGKIWAESEAERGATFFFTLGSLPAETAMAK